ncbi:Predicted membrane-bound peptidoglycan-binding family protein [Desulfamplus magnetovallimortis]|uniref:Predicted membrane-bound peptidoglycan-binding family protein n=1 Tax=Desulfamplus magnetovallimortis TaxID=1246637 RepID=A0A1W1H7W6_9BACT|nr:lytic transglycosylase domain-containing protein [Desulfamplus magnetovallimortis]SLM28567.1 Predicted membrane-bound peptidoglycan-binding family protein [Desulfamplus magnetovallimortis]
MKIFFRTLLPIAILAISLLIPAIYVSAADQEFSIERMEPLPSLFKSTRYSGSLNLCGEKIPVHIHDVRERLEKEMLLALWDRAQVILWIKRASQYFPHMERILKEEGLPDELKYVAVIESGLRANAGSSKGAVGFWQFIPDTARRFGLRVDSSIDERRNLFKSTRAACAYLKKLYGQFNSWALAMAAYNMGESGLSNEISFQEINDYYQLYLYLETQRYVFKVIAAREIMENPGKYGFNYTSEDLYPVMQFSKVNLNLPSRIPLTLIASAAETTFKEIKDLNPDIRGYHLTSGKYEIFVPHGRERGFERAFSNSYSSWKQKNSSSGNSGSSTSKKYHVVRKGEGLSMIAQRYGVPLSTLLGWNNLKKNSVIHPGDRLIIYTK